MKSSRYQYLAFLFALGANAPCAEGATTPPSNFGGNSISAVLAANQQDLATSLATQTGLTAQQIASSPLSSYEQIYNNPANGGGPTLASLGINLASITNSSAFHSLYWAFVLVAGALAAMRALNATRKGGAEAMDELVGFIMKLFAGVLIAASPALVYAIAMTLRDTFVLAVSGINTPPSNNNGPPSTVQQQLQQADLSRLALQAIQNQAITDALNDRIGMTQQFSNETDLGTAAQMMNDLATAVNSAGSGQAGAVTIPNDPYVTTMEAGTQVSNDGEAKQAMAQQFRLGFTAILTLATPTSISVEGASLPTAGAGATAANSAIMTPLNTLENTPVTPANQPAMRQAMVQYKNACRIYYKNGLDQALQPLAQLAEAGGGTNGNPFAKWLTAKGVANLESAAGAAKSPGSTGNKAADFIMGIVNNGLGWVIARVVNFGVNIMIEVSVLLMVLTMPLWLFPATAKAFTGTFRVLFNATLFMPVFQVLAYITDAIFGGMMAKVVPGTLVGGILSIVTGTAAASALAAAAIIIVYVAVIILLVFITPKIIAAVFTGAGVVGALTGAVLGAGIATALIAAKIGGAAATGGASAAAGAGAAQGAGGAAGAAGGGGIARSTEPPLLAAATAPTEEMATIANPSTPGVKERGEPSRERANDVAGSIVAEGLNRGLAPEAAGAPAPQAAPAPGTAGAAS